MRKIFRLALAAFVGFDLFAVTYLLLAQARLALFGKGYIPGGGSAIDMALFLVPVLLGYVAGDRLYWFLSYKYKRANDTNPATPKLNSKVSEAISADAHEPEKAGIAGGASSSVKPNNQRGAWDEGGWSDSPEQ